MSFLPIFDRPNSIGEINCFLRRVVLQNGNSLLTRAESRVTLTAIKIIKKAFLRYALLHKDLILRASTDSSRKLKKIFILVSRKLIPIQGRRESQLGPRLIYGVGPGVQPPRKFL